MECTKCKGGYNVIPICDGDGLRKIKEWCPHCKGSGKVPYDGDRTGTEWES